MKFLISDHNQVLADVKKALPETKSVEEAYKVIVWQDIISPHKDIIECAKKLGKETIVVQHGRGGERDYLPPISYPLAADKFLVWGDEAKDKLAEYGIEAIKVGTTLFSHLKSRKPHTGINIVYEAQKWDGTDVEENIEMMEALKNICDRNNWNLKAKTVESHRPERYSKYEVYSNRADGNHLKVTAGLLATTDIVVGIEEGTFELFSEYLNIPTICCDIFKPRPFAGDERRKRKFTFTEAVKTCKLDTLEETIKDQLKNPEELKEQRKEVVRRVGGTDIKDPLKKILEICES